jgi:hypothetical protein
LGLGGHCCSLGIAHPSGGMEVDYLGAKGEYTPVLNQRGGAWQPFLPSVKILKFFYKNSMISWLKISKIQFQKQKKIRDISIYGSSSSQKYKSIFNYFLSYFVDSQIWLNWLTDDHHHLNYITELKTKRWVLSNPSMCPTCLSPLEFRVVKTFQNPSNLCVFFISVARPTTMYSPISVLTSYLLRTH